MGERGEDREEGALRRAPPFVWGRGLRRGRGEGGTEGVEKRKAESGKPTANSRTIKFTLRH